MTQPVRIQRSRKRGWRMPLNTVYVGRGSKFGNPIIVGQPYGSIQAISQRDAVEMFRYGVLDGLPEFPSIKEVKRLRGKNVACWCALDQPCHADVLLEIANK